jgi:hypothetical protein
VSWLLSLSASLNFTRHWLGEFLFDALAFHALLTLKEKSADRAGSALPVLERQRIQPDNPLPELLTRIKIDLKRLFVTVIDHSTGPEHQLPRTHSHQSSPQRG